LLAGLAHALPAGLTLKQLWVPAAAALFAALVFLAVAAGDAGRQRWLASTCLRRAVPVTEDAAGLPIGANPVSRKYCRACMRSGNPKSIGSGFAGVSTDDLGGRGYSFRR